MPSRHLQHSGPTSALQTTKATRLSSWQPTTVTLLLLKLCSLSVRILDISPGGALLQSNQSAAKVGSRGRLSMTMAGQPFSADVEVRRVSIGVGNVGHRIGVMFVDLSSECQQMIERFTRQRPA